MTPSTPLPEGAPRLSVDADLASMGARSLRVAVALGLPLSPAAVS